MPPAQLAAEYTTEDCLTRPQKKSRIEVVDPAPSLEATDALRSRSVEKELAEGGARLSNLQADFGTVTSSIEAELHGGSASPEPAAVLL